MRQVDTHKEVLLMVVVKITFIYNCFNVLFFSVKRNLEKSSLSTYFTMISKIYYNCVKRSNNALYTFCLLRQYLSLPIG